MRISGLVPALVTPVRPDGSIDLETTDRLVDFLIERGAAGVCLGGATSEYPRFELDERLAVMRSVSRRMPPDRMVVAAIGSSSLQRTVALGRAAFDLGCQAVLLPMPWFFPYGQPDLAAYAGAVSDAVEGPTLLYDLPGFTSGLEVETAIELLESQHRLIGIKDSSGQPDRLARFAAARAGRAWSLLVGDDRHGLAAARQGWDGAISGLAACCPELLVALHAAVHDDDTDAAGRLQGLVDELIARLSVLPTPWGVKVALSARGLPTGPLALPVSAERRAQIRAIEAWLPGWLAAAEIPHLLAVSDPAA